MSLAVCGPSPRPPEQAELGHPAPSSSRLGLQRQTESRAAFSFFRAGNLISAMGWLLRPSPMERWMGKDS